MVIDLALAWTCICSRLGSKRVADMSWILQSRRSPDRPSKVVQAGAYQCPAAMMDLKHVNRSSFARETQMPQVGVFIEAVFLCKPACVARLSSALLDMSSARKARHKITPHLADKLAQHSHTNDDRPVLIAVIDCSSPYKVGSNPRDISQALQHSIRYYRLARVFFLRHRCSSEAI